MGAHNIAVYVCFVPMHVRSRTFKPGMFRPITSSSHCKFVPWRFRPIYKHESAVRRNCHSTKWFSTECHADPTGRRNVRLTAVERNAMTFDQKPFRRHDVLSNTTFYLMRTEMRQSLVRTKIIWLRGIFLFHYFFSGTSMFKQREWVLCKIIRWLFVRKRIHHWCSVSTGKSQPSCPPFHWETRQGSFPTGTVDPRVGIFLSPPRVDFSANLCRIRRKLYAVSKVLVFVCFHLYLVFHISLHDVLFEV